MKRVDRLTANERALLVRSKRIIEKLKRLAIEAAKALKDIRDQRLYRQNYATFEEYCRERWGFDRQYGYRLCNWAEVAANLSPIGDIPVHETHARPLSTLTPDQQRSAWSMVRKTGERITAAQVARIAAVVRATPVHRAIPISFSEPRTPSTDLPSPIAWFGGKKALSDFIIGLLPAHRTYIEPFFGSGSVLFAKPPSAVEIANDIDGEIVHFFRVLRDARKAEELQRVLTHTPYAREEFAECCDRPDVGDAVERARRFFVRCRQSYGGIVDDTWSLSLQSKNRASEFAVAVDDLTSVSQRLRRVQVECRPFADIIPKCDNDATAIYCDPPYLPELRTQPATYRHEMTRSDHEKLLALIGGLRRAKVLISGYRGDLYDSALRQWNRYEVKSHMNAASIKGAGAKPNRIEVIWTNF